MIRLWLIGSLLVVSVGVWGQMPSVRDWYPEGLSQELVRAKGVQRLEMENNVQGKGHGMDAYEFDSLGQLVGMWRYEDADPGQGRSWRYDAEGRVVHASTFKVPPLGEDPQPQERTSESHFRYEEFADVELQAVKGAGMQEVARTAYGRYLNGRPSQIEYFKQGKLVGMRFEVPPGDDDPRIPKDLAVEVNRYDRQGQLVHQTDIAPIPTVMAVDSDPADYHAEFERTERHFTYRDGHVVSYSDSSFYQGKFDSHYGYTATYSAAGELLEKHYRYGHNGTFLKYAYHREHLLEVETRTTDIRHFSSYQETETKYNEGGLPAMVTVKAGNGGRGIYNKITTTYFRYRFFENR